MTRVPGPSHVGSGVTTLKSLLRGGSQQFAKVVNIRRGRVAHDYVAQAALAPGLDTETLLASCGISHPSWSDSGLILHHKHRDLMLANLKQQLRSRAVPEVHELAADQLER